MFVDEVEIRVEAGDGGDGCNVSVFDGCFFEGHGAGVITLDLQFITLREHDKLGSGCIFCSTNQMNGNTTCFVQSCNDIVGYFSNHCTVICDSNVYGAVDRIYCINTSLDNICS